MKFKHLLAASAVFVLSACGSSGSDSDADSTNQLPTVDVVDYSGTEKQSITVDSTAQDSDGSIASYSWTQISGPNATFSSTSGSVDITLPEVSEPTVLEFRLTVTDNGGATASSTFEIAVEPILTTYTITGTVKTTRTNVVATELSLAIGNQTFIANTNELGVYTVQIELDDANFDDYWMITTNPNSNSINKLVSIVPSINTLLSQISEGNVINESVTEALNVNSATTSNFILANIKHEQPFETYQEYEQRFGAWDPELAFETLILVELLANEVLFENFSDPELQSLPSDFTSIYEYLDSPQTIESIIALVINANKWTWENALEDISEDRSVSFDDNDTSFSLSEEIIGLLKLEEDGTGSIDGSYDTDFTWYAENNKIVLNLSSEDFPPYVDGGNRVSSYVTQMTLTPIYSNAIGYLVNIEQAHYHKDGYSNAEVSEYQSALLPVKNTVDLEKLLAESDNWYFDFYDKGVDVEVPDDLRTGYFTNRLKEIRFNNTTSDNGEYSVELTRLTLNAEMEAEFETQDNTITFTDGKAHLSYDSLEIELAILDWHYDGTFALVATIEDTEDADNNTWSRGTAKMVSTPLTLTEQDISGKYFAYDSFENSHYWYEFNADGTMAYIYANDSDGNGVIDDDMYSSEFFSVSAGVWKVEDGLLKLLRHAGNKHDPETKYTCLNGVWSPALSDECVAYMYREWQPLFDVNDNHAHGHLIAKTELYYDREIDREAYPELSAFIPYIYTYAFLEFAVSDQAPVVMPIDAYQQAAD